MRKDWKYILYLTVVIGLYVAVKLSSVKKNDWSITLAHDDKEPYGTYVLDQLFPSLLGDKKVINSYKTVYEFKDSLKNNETIFILATTFNADKEDADALLNHAEQGGTVFISANDFSGHFADTLGIATRDRLFENNLVVSKQDTSQAYFVSAPFDSTHQYNYRRENIHNYFSRVDSVMASVITKNDEYQPVTLRIAKGSGQLILNCTPMAFTNIYMLAKGNDEFISKTLSYLPENKIYRTEYYHLGRMEASTPLRFILTTEPLTWAYYITIISILLFMIFEAKRKQRIIPVIQPLANTTLEFVSTVGNLYYQKGDHKNIAEKKIQFFFEELHSHYFLPTQNRDEAFIVNLSKKTGYPETATRSLIRLINQVLSSQQIGKERLVELNDQLEQFSKRDSMVHAKNTKTDEERKDD